MSATFARSRDSGSSMRDIMSSSSDTLDDLRSQGVSRYREAFDRLQQQWLRLKDGVGDLPATVNQSARAAARSVDDYARDNPWKTAGSAAAIAALVVVAITLLSSRR